MKMLALSNSKKKALLDDEDYERVKYYTWNLHERSIQGRICNGMTGLARFIINAPKEVDVDHINHNIFDNRKCNLRLATRSQNRMNTRKPRNRRYSSKYKGVTFRAKSNKWEACIALAGDYIYLGCFNSEIAAAKAYNEAALRHFGEFACLNFIPLLEVIQ